LRELAEDAEQVEVLEYEELTPQAGIGYPLMPRRTAEGYLDWPLLTELIPTSFPGVKTSRDDFLVDIDHDRLKLRIERYFDPAVSDEELLRKHPSVMTSAGRFDAAMVRRSLLARPERQGEVVRYCYRPFDVRWLYWEPETKLLDEKRAEYVLHIRQSQPQIISQQRPRRDWSRPQVVQSVACIDLMDRSASNLPLFLHKAELPDDLFGRAHDHDPRRIDNSRRYNLSDAAVEYLERIGSVQGDAPHLFHHAIAVMHSPAYREENAGALRQDWPRIPLPETREQLLASGELGRRLAALLNPEVPVPGVTTGNVRPELRVIGAVQRRDGGQLSPEDGDLDLTAGWGYAGTRGVTMPGRGRAEERAYTEAERAAIADGAGADAFALLGDTCHDVWLNDVAHWRCIPARVWEYTLGGYQVIKKWLSYREKPLLGRALKPEEVREVTNIARRIAAILLLERALDASYAAAKGEVVPRSDL
jgi:hypothetical protein